MQINCSDKLLLDLLHQCFEVENSKDASITIESNENKIIVDSKVFRKPIKLSELVNYLQSIKGEKRISVGGLEYFYTQKKMTYLKKEALLTEKENELLNLLINSDGKVSTQSILKQVWNYNEDISTTTLDTHLYRLRQKLESIGLEGIIVNEDDGYKFIKEKS